MASTALMHALMQSYCYASAEDIFDQQRAYTARLRRHAVSEEVSAERFFALFAALKELLISGGLSSNSRWLQAARLWQCVLTAVPCQAGAGVQWAPTPGVALALLALRTTGGPTPQPGGFVGLAMRLQAWAAFAASMAAGSVLSGGVSGGEQQTTLSHINARKTLTEPSRSLAVEDSANLAAAGKLAGEGPPHPLSPAFDFDSVAMLREAPDCLANSPELWITACVAEALGSLDVGWAPEGTSFPSLAHAAAAGADALLASAQAAGAKLSAAELRGAAHLAVLRWATAYEMSVVRTRAAAVADAQHHGNVVRRSMGSLALQLATQHPTFGPLTSPEFVCARRWIAFSAIGAGVIAGLTCSIWIFWRVPVMDILRTKHADIALTRHQICVCRSKALVCCAQVRGALECDARATNTPCHGYAGSCADLADTYYRFASAGLRITAAAAATANRLAGPAVPPEALACDAWPNDNNSADQLLSGLISAAVALPTSLFVNAALSLSLSTDAEQVAGRTRLLHWGLWRHIALGRSPWARARERPSLLHGLRLLWAGSWCRSVGAALVVATFEAAAAVATAVQRRRQPPASDAPAKQPVWEVPELTRAEALRYVGRDVYAAQWGQGWARMGRDARSSAPPPPDARTTRSSALLAAASVMQTDVYRLSDGGGPAACLPAGVFATRAAAEAFSARCDAFRRFGLLCLFASWAVYSMFIIVYGRLIYDLLGEQAQSAFLVTWLTGQGLSQLSSAQGMLVSACELLLAATVLESLWLTSNVNWLQKLADSRCVIKGSARAGVSGFAGYARSHINFHKMTTP
jgi:hypothetical protein